MASLAAVELGIVDIGIALIYLAAVGGIGIAAAGRQSSTRDFFLGGRSLPWWAAAGSILATETSAVTFVGVPAASWSGDWSLLQLVTGFALGRVFLAFVFVRVFYRREYITVYGFLAHRYGPRTRTAASALFVLGRFVASGVRLYVGALAVAAASGWSVGPVIVVLGLAGTALTATGGIRTVVWTDVILGLTLVSGAILAGAFLIAQIPGGAGALLESPLLAERVVVVPELFGSLAENRSLVAGLLGGFVLTLATHGTDQDIAQRVLSCRDARGGALSVLGSAALILPLFALFLAVGTLLRFRAELGDSAWTAPARPNEVFPSFIAGGLPPGVTGLLLAALLAAALSSFTSALGALASTAVGDFLRPRGNGDDEAFWMRASRITTLLCGAGLVLVALGFLGSRENAFQVSIRVFTYFYGALLGPFLLGILTRRGTDRSVLWGMLLAVPPVLLLQLRDFVARPGDAPDLVRNVVGALPPALRSGLLDAVPEIGSHYWIVLGAGVCAAVGALAARSPAARGG